jgi:hypothetical protein
MRDRYEDEGSDRFLLVEAVIVGALVITGYVLFFRGAFRQLVAFVG